MKWPWMSQKQRIRDLAVHYITRDEPPPPFKEVVSRARVLAHYIETGEEPGEVVKAEFPKEVVNDKPG